MTRPLPDYMRRKIDLEIQRRRHIQEAPDDCGCLVCNPGRDIVAEFRARTEAEAERIGPAPF